MLIDRRANFTGQLFSRAEYRWNEFNKLYESLMAWFNALEPLTAEGDVIGLCTTSLSTSDVHTITVINNNVGARVYREYLNLEYTCLYVII